jgi:hypothetical protein
VCNGWRSNNGYEGTMKVHLLKMYNRELSAYEIKTRYEDTLTSSINSSICPYGYESFFYAKVRCYQ